MEWVTGAEILEHSGAYRDATTASDRDAAWSDLCAGAVNAGIDSRLLGWPVVDPPLPRESYPELVLAARSAGVEAYKRREATFGLTGYVDLQGAAIRIARDYLEAIAPIIARYATVGIS